MSILRKTNYFQSINLSNDSFVTELLSTINNLYEAFAAYSTLETGGVMSKDWHEV